MGPPPELGPDIKQFFQEQTSRQGEDRGSGPSPKPLMEDYELWVEWRRQLIAMPTWWQELLEILWVSNIQELAQKIRASFELPQWMREIHDVSNYYLAPLAPRCIQQKAFLPPLDPMFPCWDIGEEQLEKTIAYAQALQYWADKANLLMPGQPCLLVRCILELRKAMALYMSFSNDVVLDGAASPEGSPEDITRVTIPRGASLTSTSTPTEEEPAEGPAPLEVATKEAAPTRKPLEGPTHLPVAVNNSAEGLTAPQAQHEEQRKMEAPHSDYPRWTKVLHPPQPVTTAEPIPPALSGLKGRHHSQSAGGRRAQHQRVEECLQTAELHPMIPPKSPKLVQVITLLPGFIGVVACLWRDPSLTATFEAPMGPMQPEILAEPAIATMCANHIVQDEIMGATYMDTVTTSVGRVALSNSHMVKCSPRPTIEDVTDLS